LEIPRIIVHESQHIRFDAAASTVVPSAVECNISTIIPIQGVPVAHTLSEISAEIGEFDVFYRNKTQHPGVASSDALQTEEHDISSRGKEHPREHQRDSMCRQLRHRQRLRRKGFHRRHQFMHSP
jgi:hypothetical protein